VGAAAAEVRFLFPSSHCGTLDGREAPYEQAVDAARAEARMATRRGVRIAVEQAALRRVATVVARAAPPEEVFAAVVAEAGGLLSADHTSLIRYDLGRVGVVARGYPGHRRQQRSRRGGYL